jgi:TonB family protein
LTNKQTNLHVVCRVKSIKTMGAQHYIDLEFTQSAPDFWGSSIPAEASGLEAGLKSVAHEPQADLKGTADPGLRPHKSGTRTPVWRKNSVADENRWSPLAEPPGWQRELAVIKSDPALPSPAQTVTSTEDIVRPTGPRAGVLVVVALSSIATGTVIGAWSYKQATSSDPQASEIASQPIATPFEESTAVTPEFSLASLNAADAPEARLRSPRQTSTPSQGQQPRSVASEQHLFLATEEPSGVNDVANRLRIEDLQAPLRKQAPLIAQVSDVPAVLDTNRALSQAGFGLPSELAAGPAPPPPMIGGKLEPLRLISSPPAVYPPSARAQRVQGVVILEALVDATGKVVETKIILGHPLLQEAAKAALLSWRYQPARLNGVPVGTRTKVSLRFSLN